MSGACKALKSKACVLIVVHCFSPVPMQEVWGSPARPELDGNGLPLIGVCKVASQQGDAPGW